MKRTLRLGDFPPGTAFQVGDVIDYRGRRMRVMVFLPERGVIILED